MYLSHHYLIDLTGGACLSVLVFFLFQPAEFKDIDGIQWSSTAGGEYELLQSNGHGDVDFDEEIRKLEEQDGVERDEENRIEGDEGEPSKGRNKRSVSWGETKVLGEESSASTEAR